MRFQDRTEAAQLLAKALAEYEGRNPLVLAIPRGAAPMARIIADALGGQVDVVLVHKLGAPGNPEFAIGAVSETGDVYVADYARQYGISEHYIAEEARSQTEMLRRRRAQYTPVRPPIDPAGRITIVVDDGIATGSTMIAALQTLRRTNPAELVVATGVAPPDTVDRLRRWADRVVCLDTPEYFQAVGQFYRDFRQVSDEEVVRALGVVGPD